MRLGTGRFVSKDTFWGIVGAPQTLNLYAYCLNDPVNCTDPSGNLPPWLARAIDPQYNPRTAKAVDAFVQGSLAWVGISNMYRQTWRYTTGAISEGRWEDAGRGYRALTQEHFELGKAAIKIPGQVFGGIVMTPIRIFTTDIPTLWAAVAERKEGLGREWDIAFAAVGLTLDVCLTIKLYRTGKNLYKAGKELYKQQSMMARREAIMKLMNNSLLDESGMNRLEKLILEDITSRFAHF